MTTNVDKLSQAYYEKPRTTTTWSGLPLKELYTPEDVRDIDYGRDIANAGEYPFTRGIHPNMFRGRYWTRREVVGYGTPADSNERLKFQMEQGASGLSLIPDNPTNLGIDADHPLASGEIGVQGVPLFSLQDVEEACAGIPLDKISMSFDESVMSCAVTMAQYIIVAEKQGADMTKLRGTMQNDLLHARWCGYRPNVPLDLSMKISTDIIEYCTRHLPLWNTINVNLYDMREQGINAMQEIGFGLAIAKDYVNWALGRGLDIDEFAPRIAFYCSAHIDFFEEIAKLRAVRRMWARIMKEEYGAKDPRSWRFRFGVHTAGCSLVPQQPLNNLIRVAYEALAAVLGGVQSLHACSYDEPIALPTEDSNRLALRTQQILAYETGVASVADPLGGSYYVESLTSTIEEKASKVLKEIEGLGGAVEATRQGWFEREVEKAALNYQKEVESGERVVVGVNAFTMPPDTDTPMGVHRVPSQTGKIMVERVRELKRTRDQAKVRQAIEKLHREAERGESYNLMPAIIEATRAYATLGEILGTIRQVYDLSYDPLGVVKSPFFD